MKKYDSEIESKMWCEIAYKTKKVGMNMQVVNYASHISNGQQGQSTGFCQTRPTIKTTTSPTTTTTTTVR